MRKRLKPVRLTLSPFWPLKMAALVSLDRRHAGWAVWPSAHSAAQFHRPSLKKGKRRV